MFSSFIIVLELLSFNFIYTYTHHHNVEEKVDLYPVRIFLCGGSAQFELYFLFAERNCVL